MKSIIMQRATHCSVLQFNYIPANWKGSIAAAPTDAVVVVIAAFLLLLSLPLLLLLLLLVLLSFNPSIQEVPSVF